MCNVKHPLAQKLWNSYLNERPKYNILTVIPGHYFGQPANPSNTSAFHFNYAFIPANLYPAAPSPLPALISITYQNDFNSK